MYKQLAEEIVRVATDKVLIDALKEYDGLDCLPINNDETKEKIHAYIDQDMPLNLSQHDLELIVETYLKDCVESNFQYDFNIELDL